MAREKWTADDSAKMDEAAKVAAKELEDLCPESVQELARWWKAHYLKAGHKRLAYALMGYSG
mgnify:CR=1 FL=1